MTPRQFQCQFRPLLDRAWQSHCTATGADPEYREAKDTWYRDGVESVAGVRSTRDLDDAQQLAVLDHFKSYASPDLPLIVPWSTPQIIQFHSLARKAWRKASGQENMAPWLHAILIGAGLSHHRGKYGAPDRKQSFDDVMAALAVAAHDEYWIDRTSKAAEIRMRWQLRRFLDDLSWLTKQTCDWSYVCGIYSQAHLLPADVEDAPVQQLFLVLCMLDTHIRRLCADYGIRPCDLPTRDPAWAGAAVAIAEDNHHLHLGHELEHCPHLVLEDAPF
jgi:hypothetical protein